MPRHDSPGVFPRVKEVARDPNALVDTKTAAKFLGLRNHHTLEVWRSTQRHSALRSKGLAEQPRPDRDGDVGPRRFLNQYFPACQVGLT